MNQRPNLLFLLPDQQRHDFLSCYGAQFLQTPNVDRLAAEGVRYECAYSPSPICVPARAAMLTGQNAPRTGVMLNDAWLRPDYQACGIATWPELLARHGYETAAIGKMHFYPWDNRHGFSRRIIAEDKRWPLIEDDYQRYLNQQGRRKLEKTDLPRYYEQKGAALSPLPWALSPDHFVGAETCRYLENYDQQKPFALMVGFPGPHCPYDPNAEFLKDIDVDRLPAAIAGNPADSERLRQAAIAGNRMDWCDLDYSTLTPAESRVIRHYYAALVRQIDYEIGCILQMLEKCGLLDNTIIIYSSDHGDYLGDHGMVGKGTFYEASAHVPMIVRCPGIRPAVRSDLVSLTDVTATLLAAAGVELPGNIDSRPLPGLGLGTERSHEEIVGALRNGFMLFDGRWKLAKYRTGDVHLFDLVNDPQERHSLAHDPQHLDRLLAMDGRLTQHLLDRMGTSHHVNLPPEAMWNSAAFARKGWTRPYPWPFPS